MAAGRVDAAGVRPDVARVVVVRDEDARVEGAPRDEAARDDVTGPDDVPVASAPDEVPVPVVPVPVLVPDVGVVLGGIGRDVGDVGLVPGVDGFEVGFDVGDPVDDPLPVGFVGGLGLLENVEPGRGAVLHEPFGRRVEGSVGRAVVAGASPGRRLVTRGQSEVCWSDGEASSVEIVVARGGRSLTP